MRYGKYLFSCRLDTDAVLPSYKGSTFRGVFGLALKKVVCALKHQECGTCLLRQRCLYTLVFETPLHLEPPDTLRNDSPPHPFVIEPGGDVNTFFPGGASLEACLLLFGAVNDSLPYFIYAFDQMGRIGIGRRIQGKRGTFTLEAVRTDGRKIYSSETGKLQLPGSSRCLAIDRPPESNGAVSRIQVFLETPLRLKFNNRLKADLPFHVLVRGALRRASLLLACYGGGEPALDYRGLVRNAEEVKILESRLDWFDWRRYSFRQDRDMLMGGMIGHVTYEGAVSRYMPLLKFCSEVHLGKQTAFGLGKIRVEPLP